MTQRTVLASRILFGVSAVGRFGSAQVQAMGSFFWVDRAKSGAVSFACTYMVTVVFVAAALAVTLGLHQISPVYPTFFAFYAAVAASAWYGGYGPGWVSVMLSTLAVNYFFLPPLYSLAPSSADLPRLIAFAVCAVVANAVSRRQKRVETALRGARDALERTVLARTAELQSANQALTAEVEDRKRVESALRAREEWWRTIFEASSVPMGVTDLSGRHVVVNAASERLLGYSSEELRSMSIAELTHEDDRDTTLPLFDELTSGQRKDYHVTKRYRCKDGSVKWLSATVTRVPDPKGGPDLTASIVADITEQKRIEEELRASEERWRSIFEHSVVGIGTTDRERRYLSANPALQKMLGYGEEELRGLTLAEVTHPDDRDATDRGLDAVWERRQESYHIEKRMIRKDGGVVWVNITAAPVPATERDPAFLPAIVVNITEQKRAEEELRQS